MKPILNILIEGYARPGNDNNYFASPTTSLLQLNGTNYLVDPGCNGPLLSQRLKDNNLNPKDIAAIFISHYHLDHVLNIRLFQNAPIYDGSMQWEQDKETPYNDFWLLPEFKVLHTPGHSSEQFSLLVDTENFGLVCIAQDVFWWKDGKQQSDTVEQLMNTEDPFMVDHTALQESRKKVLNSGAIWIVPGHGKIFKNPALHEN